MNDVGRLIESYIERLRQLLEWMDANPFALDLMACSETNS